MNLWPVLLSLAFTSSLFAQSLKGAHLVDYDAELHEMVVKFKHQYLPEVQNGQIQLGVNPPPGVKSIQSSQLLSSRQFKSVFPLSDAQKIARQNGSSGSVEGKVDVIPLSGMMVVDLEGVEIDEMIALCQEYEDLVEVEYCSLGPVYTPAEVYSEVPPVSPDFTDRQGYFDAGENGIDAEWAWSIGLTGDNVTVRDAEWAFDSLHEDYVGHIQTGLAQTKDDYEDHGTAVMGVMMAQHNGFGVQGAVPEAEGWFYSENTGRTSAVAKMVADASAGDILILEMQTGGCDGNLSTPDYSSSIWDLVKNATDAGIVVVMAAGNGSSNLNAACYNDYHARGDNGGIIVGAGTSTSGGKMGFSTYGDRVNLRGWGTSVTTTGYGYLHGSGQDEYTSSFNGTSSATPVVASAVSLVQSWHKAKLNSYLTSQELRSLLRETGHPQRANLTTPIGPLPNVRAAIEKLATDNNVSIPLDNSNSSIAQSSSSEISSSSLSSSSSSSSVSQSSSSSTAGVDCSSYNDWVAQSYEWSGTQEYVVYNEKLYSHTDWVSSQNPEVNTGWTYEGDCSGNVSSSEVISSSSVMISSSSESTVGIVTNLSPFNLSEFNHQGTFLEFEGNRIFEVRLFNSLGELIERQAIRQSGFTPWQNRLGQGRYYIRVQSLTNEVYSEVHSLSVSN